MRVIFIFPKLLREIAAEYRVKSDFFTRPDALKRVEKFLAHTFLEIWAYFLLLVIVSTFMTKLTSAEIERFYAFVDESREPGALAALSRLDILSVPRLVPHIFIVEVREDQNRQLFVKFSGTEVDRIFGANVQGAFLEDLDLSHDGNASARFLDIVDNRTEEYVRRTQDDEVLGSQVYERLAFPLSEDQSRVDALIGFMAVSVADGLEEGKDADVRIDRDIKKLLGGNKTALMIYLPPPHAKKATPSDLS